MDRLKDIKTFTTTHPHTTYHNWYFIFINNNNQKTTTLFFSSFVVVHVKKINWFLYDENGKTKNQKGNGIVESLRGLFGNLHVNQ